MAYTPPPVLTIQMNITTCPTGLVITLGCITSVKFPSSRLPIRSPPISAKYTGRGVIVVRDKTSNIKACLTRLENGTGGKPLALCSSRRRFRTQLSSGPPYTRAALHQVRVPAYTRGIGSTPAGRRASRRPAEKRYHVYYTCSKNEEAIRREHGTMLQRDTSRASRRLQGLGSGIHRRILSAASPR